MSPMLILTDDYSSNGVRWRGARFRQLDQRCRRRWRVIQRYPDGTSTKERGAVSATAPKLLGWDVSPHAGRLRVLKTTWKTEYQGHVIELENRPSLERLIVDGKEIAREPGATWEPRSFHATIPDGNRSMKVDANTRFSKSPRGLRFTLSVDDKEIYSEVKWPARWYLPFAAVGLVVATVALRLLAY